MVLQQEAHHALGQWMRSDAVALNMPSFAGQKVHIKGSPSRMRDDAERQFAWIFGSGDGSFLIAEFCRCLGVAEDTVLNFADDLCRVCWTVCCDVFSSEGPLVAAKKEVERLKSRLNDCNLGAVKQMASLKGSLYSGSTLSEDIVTFYEPLQFVDDHSRELVLRIVADKLRQLQAGTAPQSLIDALLAIGGSKAGSAKKCDEDFHSESESRIRVEAEQVQAIRDSHTRLLAELEESKREVDRQKEQVERFTLLEQQMAQREVVSAQSDVVSQGTQTTLGSEDIQNRVNEVRRLKLALAELQAKLSELLSACSRQGFHHEFAKIASRMGMDDLRGTSVFDRLYADAQERIGRLEKLRARVLKDREALGLSDDAIEEPGVIESVLAGVDAYPGKRVFVVGAVKPHADVPGAAPACSEVPAVSSCEGRPRLYCVGGTEWKLPAGGRPGAGGPLGDSPQAQVLSRVELPSPSKPQAEMLGMPANRHARVAPRTSQSMPSLPLAGAPRSRKERIGAQGLGHLRERRARGWG